MIGWLKSFQIKTSPDERLAVRGETEAARHLRKAGYTILVRNFTCRSGEIDIIARDGDVLVFVEVKTKQTDDPSPEAQVDLTKQHQLTKAATVYLARYDAPPPARFDVVAIVWPQDVKTPEIRHTEDAFEATF